MTEAQARVRSCLLGQDVSCRVAGPWVAGRRRWCRHDPVGRHIVAVVQVVVRRPPAESRYAIRLATGLVDVPDRAVWYGQWSSPDEEPPEDERPRVCSRCGTPTGWGTLRRPGTRGYTWTTPSAALDYADRVLLDAGWCLLDDEGEE